MNYWISRVGGYKLECRWCSENHPNKPGKRDGFRHCHTLVYRRERDNISKITLDKTTQHDV